MYTTKLLNAYKFHLNWLDGSCFIRKARAGNASIQKALRFADDARNVKFPANDSVIKTYSSEQGCREKSGLFDGKRRFQKYLNWFRAVVKIPRQRTHTLFSSFFLLEVC
jgi:hypothetical protein